MLNIKIPKKIALKAVLSLAILMAAVFVSMPAVVHAAGDAINPNGLPDAKANTQTIKTVMGIAFGIIGSFAFLSMVLSGFKYITSAGDPQKTSEAKNGVVFSLVGLMIAIAAEGLVVFVINGA
jgi:hypothetical protein